MVRRPEWSNASGWTAAAAGFIAADLVTGNSLFAAVWLTSSNILGAFVLSQWLQRSDEVTQQMRRQLSAMHLFVGCLFAALCATVVGSGAGPVLFNAPLHSTALVWFSTELMNYILLTPVILSLPVDRGDILNFSEKQSSTNWLHWGPLVSVFLSEIGAFLVGGPGAMAFVIPALLWCALTYKVFFVALISMAVCFWKTLEMASPSFMFVPDNALSVFSFRMGITLLSLGPLAVACACASRDDLLQKLDKAVNTDFLTGTLARRAFMGRGENIFSRLLMEKSGISVMMIDVDNFKRINDTHGHAMGDEILIAVAHAISCSLRPTDLFGRMGGEEFAVLLAPTDQEGCEAIATRLLEAIRRIEHRIADEKSLTVTASIGLVHALPGSNGFNFDDLLKIADDLLYKAKRDGKNRVMFELKSFGII